MATVPASATSQRLVTPTFAVVTASAFAYFTALGMLLPTVPRYVEEELGGGGLAVGLAVGSFAVSAAVLRPLVGRVGDTRGRRVLVMAGTIGVGVSVLGYALAHNLAVLVLFRLVSGACEAAVFVGAATASQDLAPPERRGEAASYFSVAIYGGIALGPILGENLRADHGFTTVWVVAALWCAVAFVLGIGVPGGRPNGDADAKAPADGVRRFLYPAALRPGIVLWLGLVGLAGFAAFVPLYVDELGMDKADSVFAVYALLILGLRVVAGRVPDRLGPVRAASGALVISAAGLLVMAAFATRSGLFAGTVVFALGMTFLYPALFPLVLAGVPDNERSHAIGTFSVFFDLSQGFGAPTLGVVVALAGERAAFAAAATMSIAALFVLRGSSFAAGTAAPGTRRERPGPCEEPPPQG